jgi:hypothetical protein
MTYDQRIARIKEWFKSEVLTRFTPPNGVDPKAAAMDVIESVNANIPNSVDGAQLDNFLASITKEIVRASRSRTIPMPKDFIQAAKNISERRGDGPELPTSTPDDLDPVKLTERRIRRGDAIGDQWLRGSLRLQLLEQTSITEKDLEPYEKWLATTAHKQ